MKLMIVDDEPEVLKVLKSLLESLGYEVLALADSREAAQRVDRQKLDGIFVDARMPHMDGPELVRHIRRSTSNSSVPIVMLTGYDDVETMRTGFRAGITFFLPKPPQLTQLAGVLKPLHGAMLREKRSYIRLPLRTIVNCRTEKGQFTSASLNIGEGGMLLEQSGGLEVGQELELRFSLPQHQEMLNPRATVVRKEPPNRIAVRFTDLSREDRLAIQDYIGGIVKE
ncbi:MAG: response regulator [Acidobacteriia bacterium]|nr:response regulator [Terriglobia bacterium]